MTRPAPSAIVNDGTLLMVLGMTHGPRRVDFDGVLDQGDLGDIVGLEILDFRAQLGDAAVPDPSPSTFPRWSYDDEIDAFYVRIADAAAPMQRPIVGTATFDGDNRLASIEVRLGS
jgi:hypothetical protein